MSFSKNKKQETLIYLVLWGLLFMAPILSLYIRTVNDGTQNFDWSEIFMVWREFALFLVIFIIHNHLLAPLLVYKQKKVIYFSIVTTLVVAFSIYQCSTGPGDRHEPGPRFEMREGHRPPPEFGDRRPPHRPNGMEKPDRKPGGPHPPQMFSLHDLTVIVMLVLMLFANLGIKLYFKQRRDQLQLAKLEKQNLEQQLEYLKYQLNPHFLMNTLNNIHALVDIDPELSKESIVELSKMLRFVLYEGNKPTVPLYHELDFLDHYITLMRLRYTDKVSITVNKPDELPNCEIPPLLFITFVENAFKHGVSYQQPSFIDISIQISDSQLKFSCRNSKIPNEEEHHGGIGLQNVKQRLDLIYGKNFTLDINNEPQEYNIQLTIPL
jgi:hypothetical protein